MATISSTIELIDKMSSTLSTIEGNVNKMKDALKGVEDQQSSIDGFSWNTFLSNAEAAGEKMVKIGAKMTAAVTTPLVLLGKKMYGNAVDYEAAYAGMTKTVSGTTEQYEKLNDVVLQLSETTPMSYVDLMGIAQTGGNLGVGIDQMETFMESYAQLQYATDQHISGENGAQDVASFLNITEGGVANIERFGSSIVHLGNNFNATEDQIIAMGNRMAAAAHLAGANTPEILGMATAFTAVGINAEAGGSAASKLFKQMQLASEVGGQAQEKLTAAGYDFQSALDFSYAIDSMKKADLVSMADSLGMTTEAVKSMADSWVLMDQFAQVSGKTTDQFINDWGINAVGAMSDFFTGLSKAGENGSESILATLDKMGLTEIRESNLIAAMASRPELFANAVSAATEAYTANVAMMEEFNKQMETQAAQNEMLSNKLDNTMANFGENLVSAVQPALDKVNELLTAFNNLSETDQDAILTAFAVFAAGGPIVTAIGGTVEAIGKIGTGISRISTKLTGWLGNGGLSAVLSNPVTWGVAAGAGILLLIDYLDSIPTKMEVLSQAGKDIPITIDEETYNDTLSKISEVQAALDGLKPGEIRTEYENTSAAVAYGFGTTEMYATALAYEAAKANAEINQVASDYAVKMQEAEKKIADAAASGDTAAAQAAKSEWEGLRISLDSELDSLQNTYTNRVSELFTGMASQFPDAAKALSTAADNYDVAVGAYQLMYEFHETDFENVEKATEAYNEAAMKVFEQGFNAGLFDDYAQSFNDSLNFSLGTYGTENYIDFWNWDNFKSYIEEGGYQIPDLLEDVLTKAQTGLNESLQSVSDNPMLSSYLQALINDPTLTENLDVTNLSGALEGIFKTLDYKNALEAGDSPAEWGSYVTQGLAEGISSNASVPADAGNQMGTGVIDSIKAALGVASPSIFMIEAGLNADQGLMIGIQNGQAMVIAAATAVSNRVVSTVRSILSPAVASGIGYNFSLGLANGISSGASAVISAAIAVARAGVNAARGALGIHSPSTETYWQGEMLIQGYVNALEDGTSLVRRTVENSVKGTEYRWNSGLWNIISSFAEMEQQALQDEYNNVTDGIKISDSDIKKLRTLAEREVINKITTPSFNVEFNPTIHTTEAGLDADGVIRTLEDYVVERLEACAEGVYT